MVAAYQKPKTSLGNLGLAPRGGLPKLSMMDLSNRGMDGQPRFAPGQDPLGPNGLRPIPQGAGQQNPQVAGLQGTLSNLQNINQQARAGLTPRATPTPPAPAPGLTTFGGAFGQGGPKTVPSGMQFDPGNRQPYFHNGQGRPGAASGNYQQNVVDKQFGGTMSGAGLGLGNRLGWLSPQDQAAVPGSARNSVYVSDPVTGQQRQAMNGTPATPLSIEERYDKRGLLTPRDRGALVREKALARADSRRMRMGNLTMEERLRFGSPGYALNEQTQRGMNERANLVDSGLTTRSRLEAGSRERIADYGFRNRLDVQKAQNEGNLGVEAQRGKNLEGYARAQKNPNDQIAFRMEAMQRISEVAKTNPKLAEAMLRELGALGGGPPMPGSNESDVSGLITPRSELMTREHADALNAMKGDPNQVHKYLTEVMRIAPDSPEYLSILNNQIYPETNTGGILGLNGGYRDSGNLAGNPTSKNWNVRVDAQGTPQPLLPRRIGGMIGLGGSGKKWDHLRVGGNLRKPPPAPRGDY